MNLYEFFQTYTKVALAFSGGCDSAYLLSAAKQCSIDIKPYFVKTEFQPKFELEDALRLGEELSIPITVLSTRILEDEQIVANPSDRCYHCKRKIMSLIKKQSLVDGYSVVIDGNNASDDCEDRPGMRATGELGVLSPLRLCDITKDEVRRLSKELTLFTWDKPAYACLATRVPTHHALTISLLETVEKAEDELRALGFSDFRLRIYHNAAQLQVNEQDMIAVVSQRAIIQTRLKPYFERIFLDLAGRARNG